MDSRIVATLQTILQKPGHLQDPGQGGIEIAQMQLQLLMTPFNLPRCWQNRTQKAQKIYSIAESLNSSLTFNSIYIFTLNWIWVIK